MKQNSFAEGRRELCCRKRGIKGNAMQPTESSPVSSSSSRKVLPSSPVCLWPVRTRIMDTLHHRNSAKMIPQTADTGMKMSENRPGNSAPWAWANMVAISVMLSAIKQFLRDLKQSDVLLDLSDLSQMAPHHTGPRAAQTPSSRGLGKVARAHKTSCSSTSAWARCFNSIKRETSSGSSCVQLCRYWTSMRLLFNGTAMQKGTQACMLKHSSDGPSLPSVDVKSLRGKRES